MAGLPYAFAGGTTKTNVGASLLAMAVYQSNETSTDSPSSPAGWLPQRYFSVAVSARCW
jgi:hypothetical protein